MEEVVKRKETGRVTLQNPLNLVQKKKKSIEQEHLEIMFQREEGFSRF